MLTSADCFGFVIISGLTGSVGRFVAVMPRVPIMPDRASGSMLPK